MKILGEAINPEDITEPIAISLCSDLLENLIDAHGTKGSIRETIEKLEQNLTRKFFGSKTPTFHLDFLRESSELGQFGYSFELHKGKERVTFDLTNTGYYRGLRFEQYASEIAKIVTTLYFTEESFVFHYSDLMIDAQHIVLKYFFKEPDLLITPSLIREAKSKERDVGAVFEISPYEVLKEVNDFFLYTLQYDKLRKGN